jgi:hypothetical protein
MMRWVGPVERREGKYGGNVEEEHHLGTYVFVVLEEMGVEDVDVSQDGAVNTVMTFGVRNSL